VDDREKLLADMDPVRRFSDRAADYRRHRPDYPAAALDAGKDWKEVATTIAKQDPESIDLGMMKRQDLPQLRCCLSPPACSGHGKRTKSYARLMKSSPSRSPRMCCPGQCRL